MKFLALIMSFQFAVGFIVMNKVISREQAEMRRASKAKKRRLAALCCKSFRPDGD